MSLIKVNIQLDKISQFLDSFIEKSEREYRFRLGQTIASSLSGFIAGLLVGSLIWLVIIYANVLPK